MDLIELDNNMEGAEDESAEQLLSPSSSDTDGILGDPRVLPRVGDQYQAQIPPLMMEHDHFQLTNAPIDIEVIVEYPNSFLLGLPIPIMWACDEVESFKLEAPADLCNQADIANVNGAELESSEDSQITSNNENANLEAALLNGGLDDGKNVGGQPNLEVRGDKMDHRGKGGCPLPGSLGESWKDVEHDSFVLGLFIFGKNLLLVKKFVECKEMGDLLSFYYGKFYRSDGYRRWAEGRKTRSRRCIQGQRIFTGLRQQELLSRLSSHVSEECQNKLLEVSRTFAEGKISLEEYVFTLRDSVGINMLIEAVGIGRGKQDLTRIAMEPAKTNHVFSARPELPIGKACSSLSPGDIIKFLTGDFRLSKARSNDLFWEAVWPRLLAKGWHSEQPKDHGLYSSKHSLVFLTPGIKKFSRRKLVKGDHYFDSVSDVLNKVASDPGLLELEIEADEGSDHEVEHLGDMQVTHDSDGLSNQRRHCYLQPRIASCNQALMKFTIVDTSLMHGEKRSKVRELRSLPVDMANLSSPSSHSSDTEQDTSDESKDEAKETTNLLRDITDRGALAESSECVTSILNNGMPAAPDSSIVAVENYEGQHTIVYNDEPSRNTMKYQFSRKVKSGHSNSLASVTTQQLNAARHDELSHSIEIISTESKLNEEISHCQSNSPEACANVVFQVGQSQHLSSACSSAHGSPDGIQAAAPSLEKPEPRALIDLNLPHIPSDFGADEPSTMDMVHAHEDLGENKSSFVSETSQQPKPLKLSDGAASLEQQPSMNNRRQSTRNRPLTTKALEALEYGFFNAKKKRKRGEGLPQNNSRSGSTRRVRGKTGVSSTSDNGVGNDMANCRAEEEGSNGGSSGNTNMVGESQF